MRPTTLVPTLLALALFLAAVPAIGCGSSHHTVSVNGKQVGEGTCEDNHCEFTWEFAFKGGPDVAAWAESENRGVVFDASGEAFLFEATLPHRLLHDGRVVVDIRVDRSGTLLVENRVVGWVALGLAMDGAEIALLVDTLGRRLDLVPTRDGVRAVVTDLPAPLSRPTHIEGSDARPGEDVHMPLATGIEGRGQS